MDGFRRSESHTTSRTSVLSLDQLADDDTSSGDSPVIESMNTEWTDEKHSLYLKSMEASFVNQLYNSMDSLGWRSQEKNSSDVTSSRKMHHNSPSGQFKVLQDGCWQKINFERPEPQPNKAHDSRSVLASPWIRHFKSGSKPQTLASPSPSGIAASKSQSINLTGKKAMPCGADTSSEHFDACHSHSCHHEAVGSNTEVSDQNFVDEEIKSEKATSSICNSKKMKYKKNAASSRDQVVPYSKTQATENGREKCVFSAR